MYLNVEDKMNGSVSKIKKLYRFDYYKMKRNNKVY